MKKSLIAAAVLGVVSGAAFAQATSTVTLYGRINTSFEGTQAEAEGADLALVGGTPADSTGVVARNNSSRFGLTGTEDLGGGLKARFGIESGFNSDTGASGFGSTLREATVGLITPIGEVRLGRIQGVAVDALFGANTIQLNHNTGTTDPATSFDRHINRVDNGLVYISPSFSGLQASARVALAGTNNTVAGTRTEDGALTNEVTLTYGQGPFTVGYGYQFQTGTNQNNTINIVGVSSSDLNQTGSGTVKTGVVIGGSAIGGGTNPNNQLTVNSQLKLHIVGASYDFGIARLAGVYQNYTYENLTGGASDIDGDYFQVGVSAPFGKFDVGANYIYDKPKDLYEGTSYQIGGGYNFSKRTRLYAFYDFKEQEFQGGTDATFKTNVFAVGVRHNF